MTAVRGQMSSLGGSLYLRILKLLISTKSFFLPSKVLQILGIKTWTSLFCLLVLFLFLLLLMEGVGDIVHSLRYKILQDLQGPFWACMVVREG